MMMTTLSREHIFAIRFASYNATVARMYSQKWQAMQTCTGFAILIEANAGKVERAIEEAALKGAEEREYIEEPEEIEMVGEPLSIRLRRAR